MRGWLRRTLGLANLTMKGENAMADMLDGAMVSARMRDAVGLWTRMYRGEAPWLGDEVCGMNLPAFVAGEVARLATVEMAARVTGAGARAAALGEALEGVVDGARTFVEYAAAGGSVALKPYVDGGRICVDVVRAGEFYPTAVDGRGQVCGCLFVERRRADGVDYARVEAHSLEDGGYRVCNRAYRLGPEGFGRGREVALGVVAEWADLAAEAFLPGVLRPLFAVLRMPGANAVEPGSPLGVSAYARAVDLIREADLQFARLLWEMESGKRALYVDMRAFAPEESEPGALPFTRFYRTMDTEPGSETLFAAWSPQLREQSHLAALDEILQRVEDACGLSRGTLSQAPESASRGARTATELKIMRQRTYATVRDTQRALEVALRQLVGAMDVWCTVEGICEAGDWDLVFEFDDSVVTDRGEAFAERVKLVEMGILEAWELRKWYTGEDTGD